MRHVTLRVFDDSSVSIFFLVHVNNSIAYRLTSFSQFTLCTGVGFRSLSRNKKKIKEEKEKRKKLENDGRKKNGMAKRINIAGARDREKKCIHTFFRYGREQQRKQTLAASNNVIHVNKSCMLRNVMRILSGFRFSI